ncbi:uncharacterized protein [Nothobranchius furzeri]|uniref:uncharacterized protein isoform X1 n=1 Tax=Nothobranchius furzeri TaxID=105023 RepID=UPI0039048D60
MEQQNPKLPIPRLPSTSQKTFKKFKSPSSKVVVRRLRQLSRINIGDCFKRWRDFRDLHGLKTDEELAKYLLDSHQSKYEASTSTPLKRQLFISPTPVPALSSIHGESSERDVNLEEVMEQGETKKEGSSQMLSCVGIEANIDEEEFNNIQNSVIDSSDDTWSPNREPEVDSSSEEDKTIEMDSGTDDSGDEDYTPYTHIRTGAALQKTLQLETLQEINIVDTVHDCNIPEATDATPVPDKVVVNIPGDIIGQPVSMVYHKCMQQLAEFLLLPVQVCTEKDPQTSEECGASAPFIINISSRGTAMIVKWCCPKSHVVWQWNSQPTFKFGMQAGDFMLSSNILLSGNNFAKIALMFKYMNMGMVTRNTFFFSPKCILCGHHKRILD